MRTSNYIDLCLKQVPLEKDYHSIALDSVLDITPSSDENDAFNTEVL